MYRYLLSVIGAVTAVLITGMAHADRQNDTLRIAFHDPISMVDIVYDPKPETQFTSDMVFDTLITFDDWKHEFRPLLAKSWKRVDAKTLEFKLRDDIKFHDGSAFDADDVVYTVNWVANPKVRFRIKSRFLWIAKAEKIDRYTVRIHTKRPYAAAEMRIAKSLPIYPSDVHGALKENKNRFGRQPVGTGPYRVTQVDSSKGVILVRNENYRHGNPAKPAGTIGRFHIRQIPDFQTQIAEFITGGIDLLHNAPKEQMENLAADPRFDVTYSPGLLIFYISLDAAGRSGKTELTDPRVRKAILQAIDRDAIRNNLIPGGIHTKPVDALCFRFQRGCDYSTKPPPFDRAAARRLLKEAGLADGFAVELTSTLPREIVEAVAGDLRRVGIRASVDKLTFGAYRKKQRAGKVSILVNQWASGGTADVDSTLSFFFSKSARNYTGDAELTRQWRKGAAELNDAERRKINRKAFDIVNQRYYNMPITVRPSAYLHTRDLVVRPGGLGTFGAYGNHMRWK